MRVVEGTADIDDVGAFVERLGDVGDRHGVTVQAFDARYVVDRRHLELAVELAARAHSRGDGIADDFGVEILLYAAGRRQITRALTMGVSEGACPIVAVVVDPESVITLERKNHSERRQTDAATTGSADAAAAAVRNHLAPAAPLGAYDEARIRSFFDVTDTELGATAGSIPDAVRERVALLPVKK